MSTNPPNPASTLERDPVCGMNVNPATAKHVHDHGGKNYYFCCAPCVEKFKADPAKYLTEPAPARSPGLVTLGTAKPVLQIQPQSPPAPRVAADAAYVCPMCPEVREP